MPVDTKWFRDRLDDRRMSQRGLARQLGLDAAAVSLMFRGKREMKIAEAAAIARLLGVPADEVMEHAGVRIATKGVTVQICAWMDGSAEVHMAIDGAGAVPHPGGDLPEELGCCICRTAGTDLDHMDGWLLFAGKIVPDQGIPAEAVNRLSFTKLRSGVLHLAKPTRSVGRGRWNLSGPMGTIANAEIEWAVPVLMVTP
ncbi:HTH_XRE domain containing protein [uncultured Caudovirales phage]|uniref:HTH_XRE domain containing protein n=1 Tax=uncultured Caudovirales phage TaxID=2100421 RepID=A0A6J5KID6_9CAUD|nr:HTH_XRE domain containing protein [uncultured Caudovirales phage]